MDMNSFIDLFVIIAGMYVIYHTIVMYRTGEIRQNGLISKGIDLRKAPDPAGYIKFMTPWNLFVGTAVMICGAVSMYTSRVGKWQALQSISIMAVLALIICYAAIAIYAQKKYLQKRN